MLKFVSGDLFDFDATVRINTVNCVGVMGKGVALAFKQRYPDMFKLYKRACGEGEVKPGHLHIWTSDEGTTVVNFPTKRHWREKSRYEDVEDGLKALRVFLLSAGDVRVTLPALGCGHGGLDWQRVSEMIQEYLADVAAEILVFGPSTSRNAGKDTVQIDDKTKEELLTVDIATVEAKNQEFPKSLDALGIARIFVSGNADLLSERRLALLCSSDPSQREIDAATACVSKLAQAKVGIVIGFGAKIERRLLKTALENGATVVVSLPSGILDFKVPADMADAWDTKRIAVVSSCGPREHWTLNRATDANRLSLGLCQAVLITDMQPMKSKSLISRVLKDHPLQVNYIDYQLDGAQLRAMEPLKASAVRRCKRENTPNVDHIIMTITGDKPSPQPATIELEVTETKMDTPVKEAWEDYVGTHPNSLKYPKRLIEVDLPIARISAHARREKSIRHGHISTLHIWWARRPLAACRAVICASLWPDPADPLCPPSFREEAVKHIKAFAARAASGSLPDDQRPKMVAEQAELERGLSPESQARWEAIASGTLTLDPSEPADLGALRFCLLDFIADFANWDNSTVSAYLETSRALTSVAHESLGGIPGTRPLVIDPFAGGGSIPVESLRVGAEAFATDLNPIPVLLNKVILEYIPKFGNQLAVEVRKWGDWMKKEADTELARVYPVDPDEATPITYLWARTISCDGPSCGAEVPLIRSLWLAKKGASSVALRLIPNREKKKVDFEILLKRPNGWVSQASPGHLLEGPHSFDEGTVKRGSATCPCCGYTTPVARVRAQLKERLGGAADARLYAVATTRRKEKGRFYRLPNSADDVAVNTASDKLAEMERHHKGDTSLIPCEKFTGVEPRRIPLPQYGITGFRDMFTPRQLLVLATLANLVRSLDSDKMGLPKDLSIAVKTLLAFAIDKQADLGNSLCRWEPIAQCPRQLFSKQAMSMVWDFAEGVVTGQSSGSWAIQVNRSVQTLDSIGGDWAIGTVEQASALRHPLPNDAADAMVTDPPYYYSVPYSDLSDFFYVWLRRTIGELYPRLFDSDLTPKADECVQNLPHAAVAKFQKDREFYESSMQRAFCEARRVAKPGAVGTVVFAHSETDAWESLLNALISAGWVVTASWPLDTEMGSRIIAQRQSTLASSVHLVCRPREDSDGSLKELVGEWRDVLSELPKRIHEWMPRLTAEGVVGADAIFACLGPALEIFSKYSRVEKSNGEAATLREYLEFVWAAVSTEALALIFKDADASGLEPDARLTAMWMWTLGGGSDSGGKDEDSDGKVKPSDGYTLEFDAARKIAQGLGVHLEQCTSLVEIKGDKAKLLPVSARTRHLFGTDTARTTGRGSAKPKQGTLFDELDEAESAEAGWTRLKGPPPGSTTLDRVHQAMILFAANRGELLRRFLVDDGVGKEARFWKLADNLNKLYPSGSEERRWVEGVLARKRGLGL